MRLKAQRMIDDYPVCKMPLDEKEGIMRVKPTTFNSAVNVNARVLCPTCDCEKVDARLTSGSSQNGSDDVGAGLGPLYPNSYSAFVLQTAIPNAPRCHGNGDLVCGKCQCHDGW